MKRLTVFCLAALVFPFAAQAACNPNDPGALGVSRIVEVDATGGPHYGDHTKLSRQPDFLRPKEVVLTFDDGPIPATTRPILDTLDRFCTKATFFYVGRMAAAYPSFVREVMARGHSMGTHTWSHPMNLRSQSIAASVAEIEKGFAAVAAAAGQPIAPFFRFPGLSDSNEMIAHLKSRNISAFTVDVVSNDSFIPSPERMIRETMAKLEKRGSGILLFHDIKAVTARALPALLTELKAKGYKVVHLTSKHAFVPDQKYMGDATAQVAKVDGRAPGKSTLAPTSAASLPGVAMTRVAMLDGTEARSTRRMSPVPRRNEPALSSWSTTVTRSQRIRRSEVP